MDGTDLYERFQTLKTWHSNDRRAPHKPLLALWAIGRAFRGKSRMVPYSLVERELADLLDRFGPRHGPNRTQYPFWRMRNDGIWEIDRPHAVTTTSSGDAPVESLKDQDIHGGLFEGDYVHLRGNPRLAWRIADSILDAHFPDSYREDIFGAIGLDADLSQALASEEDGKDHLGEERAAYEATRRRKRHPGFRPAVLRAYGERCAVCAFDVQRAGKSIAIEAAHIHWHAEAGPARVSNGLALCTLHHTLFDYGVFTLSADDLTIFVAQDAVGTGFEEALGRFEGSKPRVLPPNDQHLPDPRYLRWHHGEVFQGVPQSARTQANLG